MADTPKGPQNNAEKIFEKLNGPESLAHVHARQEAFSNGKYADGIAEGVKAYGASLKYESAAVVDGVKALATPSADTGKDGRSR